MILRAVNEIDPNEPQLAGEDACAPNLSRLGKEELIAPRLSQVRAL